MRVVVFVSEADGALARIEVAAAKKGKVEYLPVAIHAPTAEEARQNAEAFFAAEQERIAKRDANTAKRIEALKAYHASRERA